jgi:hypothetical protein
MSRLGVESLRRQSLTEAGNNAHPQAHLSEAIRDALILQELATCQSIIARYDANGLAIKGWTCTFTFAGIGLAIDRGRPGLALLAAVVPIILGMAEYSYRCIQARFIARAADIEKLLRRGDLASYNYGVDDAARQSSIRARKSFFGTTNHHHWTLYLCLVVAALAASVAV